MEATPIYEKTRASPARITLNEGSSRSSKTYSICQLFFTKMLEESGITLTVVRKTLPALKATAYKDFIDVVKKSGSYDPRRHNKSDLTYSVRNNTIEFISVDDYNKVKGRKRDHLFINEANELSYDDFVQLSIRTTGSIYMDYNPSHDEFHWIEDKIKTRNDVVLIRSTYRDNPFNSPETIREIESLKDADPNLWRIYGLGLMGLASTRIFNHFQLCDSLPDSFIERVYGLDFGYNHPTALVEVRETDDAIYLREIIYSSGLTNSDVIARMDSLDVDRNSYMFCDSAEPQRIEEIRRAGYNAMQSNKDVKKGIDTVKSKRIFVTKDSISIQKEQRGYSWKTTADGRILDEPVRVNDDAMCAIRYAIHSLDELRSSSPSIRTL